MLSRGPGAVRLNLAGIPGDEVGRYLAQVGWDGPFDRLAPLLARLDALADHVVLCLDVGAQIGPRVGLECFLARPPRPSRVGPPCSIS